MVDELTDPEPLAIYTYGTAADNSIVIDDDYISGHHCRFTYYPKRILLEDLGTTNGTWVNGVRIYRRELQPGDEVRIGRDYYWKLPTLGDVLEGWIRE